MARVGDEVAESFGGALRLCNGSLWKCNYVKKTGESC